MIRKIITPSDFGMTVTGELYEYQMLFSPSPKEEPKIRHALDIIFNDLQLIGSQDRELLASYLESIAEPLRDLRDMGIYLFAGTKRVFVKSGESTLPMFSTRYFVAPDPCYFIIGKDDVVVHRLGSSCGQGAKELLIAKDVTITTLFSNSHLEKYFENTVPWCHECMIYDLQEPSESRWLGQLAKIQADELANQEAPDQLLIADEIGKGEYDQQEFKQTFRVNICTYKKDAKIEHAALKSIAAFLNTRGGVLYIGVADDGKIVGLQMDGFPSKDKYLLHLNNKVSQTMGANAALSVTSHIFVVDDNEVCRIECSPSRRPVWLKHQNEESFYVRNGNRTEKLSPSAMVTYIRDRFG